MRRPYRTSSTVLDIADDKRIAIVGCSGSGKSTLAKRLADEIGILPTPLDDFFHGPNWTPRPAEAFRADVARIVAGDRWSSTATTPRRPAI